MTAKKKNLDDDEKPLLSSNQAAIPPSQQQNEDFDIKMDEEAEWILYSPELDLAVEEAVLLRALRTFNAQDRPNNSNLRGVSSSTSSGNSSTSWRVYVENLPVLTRSPCPEALSLCSSTVASSSSSSSLSSYSRRVRFAEKLVTEVRLRPKTPPDEQGALFYTVDEIQRFRQDYRLERSLADGQQVSSCAEASGSGCLLLNEEEMNSIFGKEYSLTKRQLNKYDISRVVVVHNNVLETYMDGIFGGHSKERSKLYEDDSTFFDNDSFWSGSITWY